MRSTRTFTTNLFRFMEKKINSSEIWGVLSPKQKQEWGEDQTLVVSMYANEIFVDDTFRPLSGLNFSLKPDDDGYNILKSIF